MESKTLIYIIIFLGNWILVLGVTYVDLSYSIGTETPLWPALRPVERIDELIDYDTGNDDWLASSYISMSEHTSTHMDAPYHASKGTWTLTEIPGDRLINVTGVMIDMSHKILIPGNIQRNYAIRKDDILQWERKNGKIPKGSAVLVRTGWGAKFRSDPKDYIGAEPKCCSFPSLALSAAKVFAERGVYGVGVDVVSLDVGYTTTWPVHGYLGARNIYLLENVANMELLPPTGFKLNFFPLRLLQSTASPVRIIAILK